MKKMYFIRRKSDGLLSTGIVRQDRSYGGSIRRRSRPGFTKYTKLAYHWSNASHLKRHIKAYNNYYGDCEILWLVFDLVVPKVDIERTDAVSFVVLGEL